MWFVENFVSLYSWKVNLRVFINIFVRCFENINQNFIYLLYIKIKGYLLLYDVYIKFNYKVVLIIYKIFFLKRVLKIGIYLQVY